MQAFPRKRRKSVIERTKASQQYMAMRNDLHIIFFDQVNKVHKSSHNVFLKKKRQK